ncbi:conserved protein, unknown function [Plasmodium ovale curtisi]|uniref:Uncharacterized protein n=2 Tax=Plasmodium ovale TaxID=36330 RepID=A0A1A8W5C6_PLAOA|nr:conserved protein, unknown function [Plasmodium ovale curtisi]
MEGSSHAVTPLNTSQKFMSCSLLSRTLLPRLLPNFMTSYTPNGFNYVRMKQNMPRLRIQEMHKSGTPGLTIFFPNKGPSKTSLNVIPQRPGKICSDVLCYAVLYCALEHCAILSLDHNKSSKQKGFNYVRMKQNMPRLRIQEMHKSGTPGLTIFFPNKGPSKTSLNVIPQRPGKICSDVLCYAVLYCALEHCAILSLDHNKSSKQKGYHKQRENYHEVYCMKNNIMEKKYQEEENNPKENYEEENNQGESYEEEIKENEENDESKNRLKNTTEKLSKEMKNGKDAKETKEKQASRKIKMGLYYEAHQLVKSVLIRKWNKKQIDNCVTITNHFCLKFAKVKQYALLCDLMYECCVMLHDNGTAFNVDYAKKIIEIFEACPPYSTEEKYKFMNKFIIWSTTDEYILGYLGFHKSIGNAYLLEKKYSLAHNHFIYLDDIDILYNIICSWRKEAYPSESDFFVLRTTLCLLVLGKIKQALQLIVKFEPDLDKKDVSLPIQVAYLITCACSYKGVELYEDVKYKYRLILNYDPDFQKYVSIIDDTIFERRNHNFFSIFQNMFA